MATKTIVKLVHVNSQQDIPELITSILIMSDNEDCQHLICRQDPLSSMRTKLRKTLTQQCPLNRSQLGLFSWSILHTFAAYYPITPTPMHKQSMLGLLKAFRNIYPCQHCRVHFEKDFDRDPPNVESRQQLSLWMCRQHNNVNRLLGKAQFECSYQKLMKRWKTGCEADQEL